VLALGQQGSGVLTCLGPNLRKARTTLPNYLFYKDFQGESKIKLIYLPYQSMASIENSHAHRQAAVWHDTARSCGKKKEAQPKELRVPVPSKNGRTWSVVV